MRLVRATFLVCTLTSLPILANAIPKHAGLAQPERIAFSGDPKAAFDVALRELLRLGHSIAQKDRDSGVIETEWIQSYRSGEMMKAIAGVRAERMYMLAITIDESEIVVIPRTRVCVRRSGDPDKDCKPNDNLSEEEARALNGFVYSLRSVLPVPESKSTSANAPVPKQGPSGARVGDKAIAVNTSGHLYSGEVVALSDASISIAIEKGTVVSIESTELRKLAIEPKPTPTPPPAGFRPSEPGPLVIETTRGGGQQIAAGQKVKVVLESGNDITGTILAVSTTGLVLDVGGGSEGIVLWAKDITAVMQW